MLEYLSRLPRMLQILESNLWSTISNSVCNPAWTHSTTYVVIFLEASCSARWDPLSYYSTCIGVMKEHQDGTKPFIL